MYSLPRSKGKFVEQPDELPDLSGCSDIFADFETKSNDSMLDSLNPWHHCYVAGLAITADANPTVWFITAEVLHTEQGARWLRTIFRPGTRWINHNVKYDAHVLANQCGVYYEGVMFCTLVAAKMIDSDRYSHSLSNLASDWHLGYKAQDLLAPYLKHPNGNIKSRNYGDVPIDILGDYACEDVNLNRKLYHYIEKRMPPESRRLLGIENGCTRVLFDIERRGMHTIPQRDIKVEQYKTLNELFNVIEPEVSKLSGYEHFEPHINAQCYMVLTERYKLPVLEVTDTGQPSYDKHTLKQYLGMPEDPRRPHHRLVELCLEWRKLWIYNNLFLKTYLNLAIDDILHATYNQTIRTGRMSCSKPNMQQVVKIAKRLLTPREGYYLFTTDARQIEFRLIVHYTQNPYALQQYAEDPLTDFHDWMAAMVGIPRRPAKTMNFMLGYGGGKKKTVAVLQLQSELMSELREQSINEAAFQVACRNKANKVYSDYHEALPELKQVSNRAADVCRQRGFIRNMYGRRRTLPTKAAFKAFNTVNQSTAADVVKEMSVNIQPALRSIGAHLIAIVHDEFVIEVPNEIPFDVVKGLLIPVLEQPSVELRVPLRWDAKQSDTSWFDCKDPAAIDTES